MINYPSGVTGSIHCSKVAFRLKKLGWKCVVEVKLLWIPSLIRIREHVKADALARFALDKKAVEHKDQAVGTTGVLSSVEMLIIWIVKRVGRDNNTHCPSLWKKKSFRDISKQALRKLAQYLIVNEKVPEILRLFPLFTRSRWVYYVDRL